MILKLRERPSFPNWGTNGDRTKEARYAIENGKLIRGTFTKKSKFMTNTTKKKINLNFSERFKSVFSTAISTFLASVFLDGNNHAKGLKIDLQ